MKMQMLSLGKMMTNDVANDLVGKDDDDANALVGKDDVDGNALVGKDDVDQFRQSKLSLPPPAMVRLTCLSKNTFTKYLE